MARVVAKRLLVGVETPLGAVHLEVALVRVVLGLEALLGLKVVIVLALEELLRLIVGGLLGLGALGEGLQVLLGGRHVAVVGVRSARHRLGVVVGV